MSTTGEIGSKSGLRGEELAAAMGGDAAARWRALEACRDYLRLVARRGRWSDGAGPAATSDLVQGAVVEAWAHFSRFRGRTPGQLRAWLRAILIHASLRARRRARAMPIGSGSGAFAAPAAATSPSRAAHDASARQAIVAALDGLSERHRTAVRLRIWDQLSFGQIGESLGVSEDAARMLYGRALVKLRESVRPGHDPG